MPVPTPRSDETQTAFISRCASALAKSDPDRPQAQRLGMCYTAWRRPHEDFQRILNNFVKFFEEDGFEMYIDFLTLNHLNDLVSYRDNLIQESFEWTDEYIKYWRMDENAKYYRTRLITANVSMNENDYTNPADMRYASSNLAWRPLNLDHNHGLRLRFPDNRIEIGKMSEKGDCIEAVIRVANDARAMDTGELIQELIKQRIIVHPSIEANPMCSVSYEADGRKVPICGYRIEETALLRVGKSLPGDPLSRIYNMPLNEALSKRLLESIQQKDTNSTSEEESMSERQADFREVPDRMKCPNCGEVQVDITGTLPEDLTCPVCGKPGLTTVGLDSGAGAKAQRRSIEDMNMSNIEAPCKAEIDALNLEIASLRTRHEADVVKMEQAHNAIVDQKDRTITGQSKEIATALREKSDAELENTEMRERVGDVTSELASLQAKHKTMVKDLTSERDDFKARWNQEKFDHNEVTKTVASLRENTANWRGKFEDANEKRNKILAEKAKAEQLALTEVKERARYQNESADLREQIADVTESYSKLSRQRVGDSKRILELQDEASTLREQITELESQISDRDDLLGKNARFNEYLKGLLRKKGVVLRPKNQK